MNTEVVDYYDSIAKTYDASRFSGTYGKYIDAQERSLLREFIPCDAKRIVDLACGTGRLLDFATDGVDASGEMLSVAATKSHGCKLHCSTAHSLPFGDESVDTVYSFHLFMHLEPDYIRRVIEEVRRVLKPGGAFVFDFPSQKRRALSRRKQGGWHGNTALSIGELKTLLPSGFRIESSRGIMLFPVHSIPVSLRSSFRSLDSMLCATFLKNYASYIAVKLVKE